MASNDQVDGFRQLAALAERKAEAFRDESLKGHYRGLAAGWRRLAKAIDDDIKKLGKSDPL